MFDNSIDTLILEHAASKYYDSTKAHEYYLKTRELKGREAPKREPLRTEEQKQGWDYVQSRIGEDKQKEAEAVKEEVQKQIEQLKTDIAAKKDELVQKLQTAIENLLGTVRPAAEKVASDRDTELKRIDDEAQNKIDALPKIPEGVPVSQRQKVREERNAKIAEILGEAKIQQDSAISKANSDMQKLSDDFESQRSAEIDSSAVAKEKLVSDLKTSIEKAKENYAKQREVLGEKYKQIANTEYDAVRTQLAPKRRPKKKPISQRTQRSKNHSSPVSKTSVRSVSEEKTALKERVGFQ